jgi:hypothetical protein
MLRSSPKNHSLWGPSLGPGRSVYDDRQFFHARNEQFSARMCWYFQLSLIKSE